LEGWILDSLAGEKQGRWRVARSKQIMSASSSTAATTEAAVPNLAAPACDGCGKDFGGVLHCSRCLCVFYCGPACQKAAWKRCHKRECGSTLTQASAQATATEVIESLRVCRAGNGGVNVLNLLELDKGGGRVYKAAQEQGLWEIVKDLFEMDANTFVERYSDRQADCIFSITEKLLIILFRGNRPLEPANLNANYSRIDAGRVVDYVSCHETAFDHWLDASLVLTLIPFDNTMVHRWVMLRPQDFATHVMRVWNMIWADHNAAKFILWRTLDADRVDKKATRDRAKSIANKFKAAFAKVYVVSRDDNDDYSNIEGLIHQLAALIDEWFQKLNISVRMDAKFLKLPTQAAHLHRQIAVPAAKETIRKGRKLTQAEFQRLVMGL